ncbi:MAG: acyl carrier protein [Hyphomicrobiaceae bacterium]|nr:acyl carrier protein [Hyphomicrobiaceae bacterium]
MTRAEIFAVIASRISETFSIPAADISESTTAADVDGWDSLSHVTLMLDVERHLKIRLPVRRTTEARNVGDLLDIVLDSLGTK